MKSYISGSVKCTHMMHYTRDESRQIYFPRHNTRYFKSIKVVGSIPLPKRFSSETFLKGYSPARANRGQKTLSPAAHSSERADYEDLVFLCAQKNDR